MEWAMMPLKRYAQFSGRSRRKEYWWFALLTVAVYTVAALVDNGLGMAVIDDAWGAATIIVGLALFVPSIAVTVRRLHDTDRSAWWLLIYLIPILGALVLFVFMVLDGTNGPNRFGQDPKDPDPSEVFA